MFNCASGFTKGVRSAVARPPSVAVGRPQILEEVIVESRSAIIRVGPSGHRDKEHL